MKEALNQWTYVMASYAVGVAGTLILTAWAWIAMRRAEARRDKARGR